MRIQFPDLSRPKAAAKVLARLSPELKLSTAQEALAHALGYRDWHELSLSAGPDTPPQAVLDMRQITHLILSVSQSVGLLDGDVQYAISKTRLLCDAPSSLAEQLRLRATIWREHLLGSPARGKPGTVIKVKADGAITPAYLCRVGRTTYVLYDTGPGMCADFEIVTPRVPLPDFVPSRLWLPYGYWTLQDGSEVLFARDYLPIWRIARGIVERVDPWLWIGGITSHTMFPAPYTSIWSRGPARELALNYLAEHRIFELPKLVDVMPHLFEPGVQFG